MTPRAQIGTALLLLALVFVTYANSIDGDFLGDSGAVVLDDPRVHALSRDNLGLIVHQQYWYPTADSGVYRPLVTFSFLVNYVVLGNAGRPAGYHWVNLGLHATNVVLVWLLVLTIWKTPLPAFFTAAIFAVHPVNVEAVTNIAGRADLMSGTGVVLGLLLYARLPDLPWRQQLPWFVGMLFAALFGLFSKENAVVLPFAMLLYDVVFRPKRLVSWRSSVIGFFAVTLAVILSFWSRHVVFAKLLPFDQPFVDNPLVAADFLRGRLTALTVIVRYVWLLMWPQRLVWDYSYNQIPLATWASGFAALGGIAAALVLILSLYRRHAPACFFGAFFLLALLPTSNVVLVIGSIMAERFLYLPSIGFAGCAVACVFALVARIVAVDAHRARLATVALAVVIAGFALRTWTRNSDWADGERFWMSALEASPNSFKTHMAPIYAWSKIGFTVDNIDRAIAQAEQAVAIVNGLPPQLGTTLPLTTLGTLYRIKGDVLVYQRPEDLPNLYRQSLDALTRALPIDQAFSQEQRRKALARGWRPDQIREKGNAFLYHNLGDTYQRLQRWPEALDAYVHLRRLTPLDGAVYAEISTVERMLGHREAAMVTLWQKFVLAPTAQAQSSLMVAYFDLYPGECTAASPESSAPNLNCPLIKAHLCSAYGGLVQELRETARPDEAERYRRSAARDYGCTVR